MRWLVSLFLFIAYWSVAFAQQPVFSVSVSKNKVATNERFQYVVTLKNSTGAKSFQPPSFQDFIVLGGPNQSSSFQNIQGVVTQSISYSYVLQPKKTGKYTIGSAYIKSGDKTLTTQPVTIEVTEGPAAASSSEPDKQSNASASQDVNAYLRENILIRTEVSDNDIYEGESFVVTLKLYIPNDGTIYGPRAFQNLKTPAYDGFYAEDMELKNEQFQIESYNGRSYRTGVIKKTILTPQRSGNLIIDPFTIDALFAVQVKKQRSNSGDPWQDMLNDFFSDPFMGSTKEVMVTLASKTTAVQVKPLPSGAPVSFKGAVGKFTMRSQISGMAAKTDEPVTYRITIGGSGNMQLISAPILDLPPGWETYEPKITESAGQKTFEFLLVPRSPGKFEIPVFAWSYFDPAQKKYLTLQTDKYPVEVTPGPGYNPNASNYASRKEKVESLGEDIRFIHKENPNYKKDVSGISTALVLFLTGVPFIGGIGLFAWSYRKRQRMRDTRAMRAAGAGSAARKRLEKASACISANNSRGFYDETIRALWGYLGDKMHLPTAALSRDTVEQTLKQHAVSESTILQFMHVLDVCEVSLFAPAQTGNSLQEVYNSAFEVIRSLEKELK